MIQEEHQILILLAFFAFEQKNPNQKIKERSSILLTLFMQMFSLVEDIIQSESE